MSRLTTYERVLTVVYAITLAAIVLNLLVWITA